MKERCGIVFVHGIVGNNRIFDFLVPLIPEEWCVKWVVLEGHGGDALGFSRASMDGWKRQVANAIVEMGDVCEKVIGVGHSMGCLLLLEKALKGKLAALFLLNPPLKIRIRVRLFRNSLKVALGLTENDEVTAAAKEAYGISLDPNPLHYYGWPKRYLELFAEIRRIRILLLSNRIPCPTVAILSCKDEMVSVSSANIIKNASDTNGILLQESHHYYYSESDKDIVRAAFREFLRLTSDLRPQHSVEGGGEA